jgi:hypothetical protein
MKGEGGHYPSLRLSDELQGEATAAGEESAGEPLLEDYSMTTTRNLPTTTRLPVRCYTRAMKNAQYLRKLEPKTFAGAPSTEGFGTGLTLEVLRRIHRLRPDSAELRGYPQVSEFLKTHKMPVPGRNARDPLFSGTVHFAQVTFQTNGGNLVTSTADMNTIVQYAKHAAVPIAQYANQYGTNSVAVDSNLIAYSVNVPNGTFTDAQLQGWVNDMANKNGLPNSACIFVICPQGISAANVGGNAGYHGIANITYIVAGVYAQNLTLQDNPDVYAMVVSHEMAEMVVDPRVDGQNPEVCDPCDINCNNLTRIYFDVADNFLGANQNSPPSGFNFAYYICAVVKPSGASSCPAPQNACDYAPPESGSTITVRRSTGNDFGPGPQANEDWSHGACFGSRGTFFADVDGDGKAECILVNDDTITVRRSTGHDFGPGPQANEDWSHGACFGSRGTFFADVDGDGKADCILVNNDTITVRRSTGNDFGPGPQANEDWSHGACFGSRDTFFADVDGDRKADCILVNNDTITVRRSTGNDFGPGPQANEDWSHGACFGSRDTFFADVDGDRKADCILVNNDTITVRRSTGHDFGPGPQANEDWTHGAYFGSRGTFFADVDGDGKADAIVDNG